MKRCVQTRRPTPCWQQRYHKDWQKTDWHQENSSDRDAGAKVCESKDFHADLSKQNETDGQATAAATTATAATLRRTTLRHRPVGLEMTERSVFNRHLTGNWWTQRNRRPDRPTDWLQACTLISYARPAGPLRSTRHWAVETRMLLPSLSRAVLSAEFATWRVSDQRRNTSRRREATISTTSIRCHEDTDLLCNYSY